MNNFVKLCRITFMTGYKRYAVSVFLAAVCAGGAVSLPLAAAADASRVDLVLESIQLQQTSSEGKNIVIAKALVRNGGSESVGGVRLSAVLKLNGKVRFQYDDIPVISNLPRAASGISVPVSLGMLEPGDYELTMAIFPPHGITEGNSGNNQKALTFKMSPGNAPKTNL